MDRASHYRKLADHARRLADATWQEDLEELLRRLARDFDDIAEDIGADRLRRVTPGLRPSSGQGPSPVPHPKGLSYQDRIQDERHPLYSLFTMLVLFDRGRHRGIARLPSEAGKTCRWPHF